MDIMSDVPPPTKGYIYPCIYKKSIPYVVGYIYPCIYKYLSRVSHTAVCPSIYSYRDPYLSIHLSTNAKSLLWVRAQQRFHPSIHPSVCSIYLNTICLRIQSIYPSTSSNRVPCVGRSREIYLSIHNK